MKDYHLTFDLVNSVIGVLHILILLTFFWINRGDKNEKKKSF